jgi:signal transduction histidine kinase
VLLALAWAGWGLAVAAALALRRRTALVADAEHELRGAATAIGVAAEASRDPGLAGPLVRLQVDRMNAALADLARARGARPGAAADLEAGRLAQVLANVSANAAEHGVGPVEVSGERDGQVLRLEVSNEAAATPPERAGRGRGLRIAKRAARGLGGRVRLERAGGVARTVIELPVGPEGAERARTAAAGEAAARADCDAPARDDHPRAA